MNRLSKVIHNVKEMKSSWEQAFLRNQEHLITSANVLDEPYRKSDMVYICISTTARAISQVPLKVFTANESGMLKPIENDPIAVKLSRPNYLMDAYSFVESIISWLMLKGGVFIVPFPPGHGGIPDSLWVVPPEHMSPIKNNIGHLTGWSYSPDATKQNSISLSVSEVCHIWFWNPFNPFKGFAPLDAGKIPVLTDYQAAMYNQMFFKQGASAGGAFSTASTLTDKQYKRLKEQLDSRYSGYKNAHKDMLLEKGLVYTAMARTHRDMEFREGRKYDAARIMQIFGMKKSIISVVDDVNKATARVDEKNWWKSTNLPMMKLTSSALNFMLFRDIPNRQIYFDISSIEALHEDFSEKVRTGDKLLKMGFTGNEINQKLELGFDSAPWRDYAYIPMTNVPVGADMPPRRPEGKEIKNIKVIENSNELNNLPAVINDSMLGSVETNSKAQVKDKPPLKSDIEFEQVWKSVVRGSVTIEKTFTSRTKRAFLEVRKLVLTWLYGQDKQKAVSKPFVLTEPLTDIVELSIKPIQRLKAEADKLYQDSLMTGLRSIATELGVSIDMNIVAQPEAIGFLSRKVLQITKVGDTVNKQVGQAIIGGIEKGETIDQIANRVKHVFNSGSKRAKTIARTETFGAINFGRHQAIKQTRFQMVKWFTALDERVRAKHIGMHGQTKGIDEMWNVAGESLEYPGDPAGSAGNIVNCRCIEIVDLESIGDTF